MKTKKNNEEWNKEFSNNVYVPHENGCIYYEVVQDRCDCNREEYIFEIKQYLLRQRQEAYEEGYKDGVNYVMNVPEESFDSIKKQAVREFVNYLKDWIEENDLDAGGNFLKIDCDDFNQVLEVYEEKT